MSDFFYSNQEAGLVDFEKNINFNPHMQAAQALLTPDIVVPCDYIAKAILGFAWAVAVVMG